MKYLRLFICLTVILLAIGCSSTTDENVVTPAQPYQADVEAQHQLWGLWQFSADLEQQTLDVIPLRTTDIHLNGLPLLEPPINVNLTVENVHISGNVIDADIGLKHPMIDLDQFTGFDVCGVLISNGSVSGFSDTGLTMAGPGDTRLLNPDGLTRWWNPSEFPHSATPFGYTDGALGVPDSIANYSSTLNGYKLFTDDITDPDAPLNILFPENRCVFSSGAKNIRHYRIQIGSGGLVFNYAVDASWKKPSGPPPYQVPDDFPPGANRVEGWNANIYEMANTLYNDGATSGGVLSLIVEIWDHFDADTGLLYIESPGNFDPVGPIYASGVGPGAASFMVDITGAHPSPGFIDLLITCETPQGGYQGLLPGKKISAYFPYTAQVGTEIPVVEVLEIYPNYGNLGSYVAYAQIFGSNFAPDAQVSLVKSDNPAVVREATNEFTESSTSLSCDFDLGPSSGAEKGIYNVKVTNPGPPEESGQLDNAFTVKVTCTTVYKDELYEGTIDPYHDAEYLDVAFNSWGLAIFQFDVPGQGWQIWGFDVTQNGTVTDGVPIITNPILSSYPGIISIDADEFTGNIVYVSCGSGSSDENANKFIAYAMDGTYIGTFTNENTDYMVGMDFNNDGSLWTVGFKFGIDGEKEETHFLNHYFWDWDSQTYIYDPTASIDITPQLGYSTTGHIYDCAISYYDMRLFIYSEGPNFQGQLDCYDISGPTPFYDADHSVTDILPAEVGSNGLGHWRNSGDIDIDHSDYTTESCRIVVNNRLFPFSDGMAMVKLDTSGNIIDTFWDQDANTTDRMFFSVAINPSPWDEDGSYLLAIKDTTFGSLSCQYVVYQMPDGW